MATQTFLLYQSFVVIKAALYTVTEGWLSIVAMAVAMETNNTLNNKFVMKGIIFRIDPVHSTLCIDTDDQGFAYVYRYYSS